MREPKGRREFIQLLAPLLAMIILAAASSDVAALVLELTSLDRRHGFAVPDLKIDETIGPGEVTRVRVVPDKAATYDFHCRVFCGSGHEEMAGQIVVSP